MTQSIGGIGSLQSAAFKNALPPLNEASSSRTEVDFQKLLTNSIEGVSALEQNAQAGIEQTLAGGDVTQVEVLSAMKKADLSLRLMMQVRNKVLEAYNEIKEMRM